MEQLEKQMVEAKKRERAETLKKVRAKSLVLQLGYSKVHWQNVRRR